MHECTRCGSDCDCETQRCSHLCVERDDPRPKPTLTIRQVEEVYQSALSLRTICNNALAYPDDAGFRRSNFFIPAIQAMWDATRSDANKARMERKRERRRQRKAARAL